MGDSSVFISESADEALSTLIQYSSVTKSLAALLIGVENKIPAVRGRVCKLIFHLISLRPAEVATAKELESLKVKLERMLRDSSPESRSWSREIVKTLVSTRLVARHQLESLIDSQLLSKALESPSAMHSAPSPSPCEKSTRKSVQIENSSRHAIKQSYLEIIALNDIFQGLNNKLWSERLHNVTLLTDTLVKNYNIFIEAGKFEECVLRLLDCFEDSNAKVSMLILVVFYLHILILWQIAMAALGGFEKVNNICPHELQKIFIILLPSLLIVSASSNK